MGYSFDIELFTKKPFVVDLELGQCHTQTLSGRLVIHLEKPEDFKIANVAVHGQIGVALNVDTKPTVVHEHLVETSTDLVAANDTDGTGAVNFPEPGTQYLPFRIDLPRPHELPPTLINKLDTHYVDWKYEIIATLQRNSIFSTPTVVKHDLILRRPIVSESESDVLTASTDMPDQFKSHLTVPSSIYLGQSALPVSVELEARHKSYIIREIHCEVVQTEIINYETRHEHPHIHNAHNPGVPCKTDSSRLVSAVKRVVNSDADIDFGRGTPIQLDVHIDNFQLIPTERGLDWLEISHVFRSTLHFMDENLEPIVTELPLFVSHEESVETEQADDVTVINAAAVGAARLMSSLMIAGAENRMLHSEKELAPEAV
ncbi:hypothetical protein BGZ80_001579 [Entomortierella chlamydospora]|uniref:Uncharacterized protein n=1 Tax=Entomortierella chlamydospora TaxID=101097 RepID=A0A9P6SXV8_9FUNG|nr:hypothetical protein BGZ79_001481 [Entomortierella chlamydospora]KAG0010337.1 hypothetical protein BGZ80_001579 [Entomortierella chlamydospora]